MLFIFHQFYLKEEFCSVEMVDQDTVIDLILAVRVTQGQHPELSFQVQAIEQ